MLAPGAELAGYSVGESPKASASASNRSRSGSRAVPSGRGIETPECGIEPPGQVDAGDVARLDHQAMMGDKCLAGLQHLGLQELAYHGRPGWRWASQFRDQTVGAGGGVILQPPPCALDQFTQLVFPFRN
jgi:hypothetical protein